MIPLWVCNTLRSQSYFILAVSSTEAEDIQSYFVQVPSNSKFLRCSQYPNHNCIPANSTDLSNVLLYVFQH